MAGNEITATTHFADLGQMRVQELPGAIPVGENTLPLQPKDVAFADQLRSDASMLSEANNNFEESEQFIATRGLIGRWNMAEIMLRAWVEPVKWKGSEQFRSHLGVPLVAEQFYAIHSAVNQTLLGGYRVFKVDPTSGTPLECALAQQAMIEAELKTCGYKGVSMKTEMREITFDGIFYGFGVAHYGWKTIKKQVIKKIYKSKPQTVGINGVNVVIPQPDEDETEDVISVYEFNQPVFEHVPVRRARYAPDLRRQDARVADWFGRVLYMTGYQIDAMREVPGWKVPSRPDIVKLTTPQMQNTAPTNSLETLGSNTGNPVFQQTTTPQKAFPESQSDRNQHDPLGRKFEIRDYWTDMRHVVILAREYVLLNETHKFGRPPFLSFAFRTAPDAAHGYGVAYWLTDFQRVCQGVVNAFLDDTNLNLMGTYTAPAGANNTAQAQWIFPGKVFKNDQGGEFKALTRNSIEAKEPLAIIAQMKQWASAISGAGIGILGANPGAAGDVRTPDGVAALQGGENVKMQDLVDVISEQVLVPFLEFCVENNQKLKPSQVKAMLSDQLGDAFKQTPLDVLNGTYKVDISAGTRLAAREALNKSMAILQTFLQSPGTVENLAVQGMKIDYNGMFESLWDAYSLPYREAIVKPMNDDDKARLAAQSQAAAQQGKLAQIQAQTSAKKEIDDNQAENRMLIETGKHTLKEQGKTSDQQNDLEQIHAAQAAKQFAQTPQAQGLDRAAKGAFATMDKGAFGS